MLSHKVLSSLFLCVLVAASVLPGVSSAQESGSLRERIRERLEQRRASPGATEGAPQPGLQTLRVEHWGQVREVLVYAPTSLRLGQPLPLVVALHGGGGYAAYMADDERYGLNRKAESAGFLVVYPNGYSKFPGGKFAIF